MIYVYECKLIDQIESNHLTPCSAIQECQMPRYKVFCKYTPFIFPYFFFNVNNSLKTLSYDKLIRFHTKM